MARRHTPGRHRALALCRESRSAVPEPRLAVPEPRLAAREPRLAVPGTPTRRAGTTTRRVGNGDSPCRKRRSPCRKTGTRRSGTKTHRVGNEDSPGGRGEKASVVVQNAPARTGVVPPSRTVDPPGGVGERDPAARRRMRRRPARRPPARFPRVLVRVAAPAGRVGRTRDTVRWPSTCAATAIRTNHRAATTSGLWRVTSRGWCPRWGRTRVALVGHGWGGVVGWTVAALHPRRVHALVAVGCAAPVGDTARGCAGASRAGARARRP